MKTSKIGKCFKYVKRFGLKYPGWRILDELGLDKNNNACKCREKNYLSLSAEDREKVLKEWFYERNGYPLDLDNPKTFCEKLQWLKLYDSTPIKTRLADKYLVREWVKETIGEKYLIPLLGVWDSFDEIDFSKLPEAYVLQCNHGSGMNVIVNPRGGENR